MQQLLKIPFVNRLYSAVILINYDKATWYDKLQYVSTIVVTSAPVVAFLNYCDVWYTTNSEFITWVLIALAFNIGVGWRYHSKMGTFSWKEFFAKNISMFLNVVVVYVLLDLLREAAGDNIVAETFKVLIQVTTLLHPVSKALKNIYVLNKKKFPPSFIMDRLYNFEKTGNIDDLYNNKEDNAA